jgi:hypothetical protein
MTPLDRMFWKPGEIAEAMGVDTGHVSALVISSGAAFTPTRPGGRPGRRGHQGWCLTGQQFAGLLRLIEHRVPPREETSAAPVGPIATGPDGKTRARRSRVAKVERGVR